MAPIILFWFTLEQVIQYWLLPDGNKLLAEPVFNMTETQDP